MGLCVVFIWSQEGHSHLPRLILHCGPWRWQVSICSGRRGYETRIFIYGEEKHAP